MITHGVLAAVQAKRELAIDCQEDCSMTASCDHHDKSLRYPLCGDGNNDGHIAVREFGVGALLSSLCVKIPTQRFCFYTASPCF
jgi:hypothetical protein